MLSKPNHKKLINKGIYLIIVEVILLIASLTLIMHLVSKNSSYAWRHAYEWFGVLYLFIIMMIVLLVVMLIMLIGISKSSRTSINKSKRVVTWIIIIISLVISGIALLLTTRGIISELETFHTRKKLPDYKFCLDCRLQTPIHRPQADAPPGNLLKFYTKDSVIQKPYQDINKLFYGLKDSSGQKITDAVFYIDHREGIMLLSKETDGRIHYGYMDSLGNTIFPVRLDYGSFFNNGYARVVLNDKFGILNKKGDFALPPVYKCIREYNKQVAVFYTGPRTGCFENGQFGAVNFSGDTIIKPSAGRLEFIAPGIIRKEIPGENPNVILYNTKGGIIRDKNDTHCSSFKYGIAVVSGNEPDYSSAIIDTLGNEVLTCNECGAGELMDIYMINQIVRRYNVLVYDEEEHKYVFLEKPVPRKNFLTGFNYQKLKGVIREYPPRNDYRAFSNYFKTTLQYPGTFDELVPDSVIIHVHNDTLNYWLTYYTKDNSLKYKKH